MDCSKDPIGLFEKYSWTVRKILLDCSKSIHGYDKTAFYCTKKIGNVRMIQQAFIVRKEWVMLE